MEQVLIKIMDRALYALENMKHVKNNYPLLNYYQGQISAYKYSFDVTVIFCKDDHSELIELCNKTFVNLQLEAEQLLEKCPV